MQLRGHSSPTQPHSREAGAEGIRLDEGAAEHGHRVSIVLQHTRGGINIPAAHRGRRTTYAAHRGGAQHPWARTGKAHSLCYGPNMLAAPTYLASGACLALAHDPSAQLEAQDRLVLLHHAVVRGGFGDLRQGVRIMRG